MKTNKYMITIKTNSGYINHKIKAKDEDEAWEKCATYAAQNEAIPYDVMDI